MVVGWVIARGGFCRYGDGSLSGAPTLGGPTLLSGSGGDHRGGDGMRSACSFVSREGRVGKACHHSMGQHSDDHSSRTCPLRLPEIQAHHSHPDTGRFTTPVHVLGSHRRQLPYRSGELVKVETIANLGRSFVADMMHTINQRQSPGRMFSPARAALRAWRSPPLPPTAGGPGRPCARRRAPGRALRARRG